MVITLSLETPVIRKRSVTRNFTVAIVVCIFYLRDVYVCVYVYVEREDWLTALAVINLGLNRPVFCPS